MFVEKFGYTFSISLITTFLILFLEYSNSKFVLSCTNSICSFSIYCLISSLEVYSKGLSITPVSNSIPHNPFNPHPLKMCIKIDST